MAPPPPPGSASADKDWSDKDAEKVSMECFCGLVRDATNSCYGMCACPLI